jgi:type II secretory pathway pseudopilin PulG
MPVRHAFTIRELVCVIGVLVILGSVIAVVIPGNRMESRRQKDGEQLRLLHQALVTWAQHGSDDYPIPSRIDRANYVIDGDAKAKDTSANIYSVLIFNGSIKIEQLVSPVETNRHISACQNYEWDHPSGAAHPDQAIWDPKFSVMLDGSRPGHASYAHSQPFGGRRPKWTNTFSASEVVLSNCGPEVASVASNADSSVTPSFALSTSNTLRFYGGGQVWSGWMAFNDNHVDFRIDYLKEGRSFHPADGMLYTPNSGAKKPDIWCCDELDDPKAANDYVGIFLKAGAAREDWKAAWD